MISNRSSYFSGVLSCSAVATRFVLACNYFTCYLDPGWNRVTKSRTERLCWAAPNRVLYLGKWRSCIEAVISWRWLVNPTCLPQSPRRWLQISSHYCTKHNEIISWHRVTKLSSDRKFTWESCVQFFICFVVVRSSCSWFFFPLDMYDLFFLEFPGVQRCKNKRGITAPYQILVSGTCREHGAATFGLKFHLVKQGPFCGKKGFCVAEIVYDVCKCKTFYTEHNNIAVLSISNLSSSDINLQQCSCAAQIHRAMVGAEWHIAHRDSFFPFGVQQKSGKSRLFTCSLKAKKNRLR